MQTNWYKNPKDNYPFDLFFDPLPEEDKRIPVDKTHFLVKWEMVDEWVPQIIVRFTHYKSVVECVTVHWTARTAEGHYQPWGAWDGCTLQGDPVDHGRKIWHMIHNSGGNYRPVKGTDPALQEWKLTTRYKDQMWTPASNLSDERFVEEINQYISEYALNA